jgi:hypothetical protein
MRRLPRGVELDEALEPSRERLRRALIDAELDDLLHAGEPDARKRRAAGPPRRPDVHRL